MEHLILLWLPMRHSKKLKQLTRILNLCLTIVSSRSSGTTATKSVSNRSFSRHRHFLPSFLRRAKFLRRTTIMQHRVKAHRQRRPTHRRRRNRFQMFRIRRNFTGSKLNKHRATKSNFHPPPQPLLRRLHPLLQHRCRKNPRTSLRVSRRKTLRKRPHWRSTGRNKAFSKYKSNSRKFC